MRLPITIAASCLCFATSAAAETALDMQAACRQLSTLKPNANDVLFLPEDYGSGYCWGAFSVFQYLGSSRMAGNKPLIPICMPPEYSRLAVIKTFMQHMADHPENGQRPFLQVAFQALSSAFPCPTPKQP